MIQKERVFNMNDPKYIEEYHHKKFIDIHKYITEEYNEILTKLDIIVEDREYSNSEFDKINSKLIRLRNQLELLSSKNIKRDKFMELLMLFDKIEADYDL